ncbi:Uncharacterised protein [Bordetella pertussis]|nr:Uncharacterised protein [Bordetella pertussis]
MIRATVRLQLHAGFTLDPNWAGWRRCGAWPARRVRAAWA